MRRIVESPDKPPTRSPLPEVNEILKQFTRILDPVGLKGGWTTSRIGIYEDGTITPILQVLAHEKYGPYSPVHFYPYWIDKDWKNESWDNIDLVEKSLGMEKKANKYGVPSGTKEYWKRYRADNRERVRKWHQESDARRRELIRTISAEESDLVNSILKGEATHEPEE